MRRKAISLLLFTFISYSPNLFAQDEPDNCIWGTFSLEKKITKRLALEAEEEVRVNQNFSRLNLLNTSLGVNYRIIKGLKVGLSYRLTEKYTKNADFSFRHRFALDGAYSYKSSNLTLSYRSRIQAEIKNYFSSLNGRKPAWEWRNKLEVNYSIKKVTPYLGAEFYFQINDPRNPEHDKSWLKHKAFAGVDFKLNKRNDVGLYFLLQRGDDEDGSSNINVIGLRYAHSLPD